MRRFLFSIQAFVTTSFLTPPVTIPVPTRLYRERAEERSQQLIILLPGKGSRAGDFERRGFVAAARRQAVRADLLAVDLHFGYYLQGNPLERLWKDVLEPAVAAGYGEIHLVGISMGGAGALGLARDHGESICSIILMAPFLGPPAIVEEIGAAGGLRSWSPSAESLADPFEGFFARNWQYARRQALAADAPRILLAFGTNDRLSGAQWLLADALPADKVFTVGGGHNWKTWRILWEKLLGSGALRDSRASTGRNCGSAPP